jgi:hypothetical protein
MTPRKFRATLLAVGVVGLVAYVAEPIRRIALDNPSEGTALKAP